MFRRLAIGFFVALLGLGSTLEAASGPQETVERIRGLKFERPVVRKSIARSELRGFLQNQMDADLPYQAEQYVQILRALHLLDDVEKPMDRLFELYEAQALAFYDPRTHVYYSMDAPAGAEDTGLPAEAVEVHELAHALQDQRFGIGPKMEAVRFNWDAAMAYQALLEGEATLVMMASLFEGMGLKFDDVIKEDSFLQVLTQAAGQNVGIPEGTPPYFVESMTFPYIDGLKFVLSVYRDGGWEAVDRLHKEPPRSTQEILNPELFRSGDRPAIASGSAGTGESGPLLVTTLGVFHWRFLLGVEAGSGWESDRVEVLKGSEDALTVLGESVWKTEADASEFAAALRGKWKTERVVGRVVSEGRSVRFAHGTDGAALEKFLQPAAVSTR